MDKFIARAKIDHFDTLLKNEKDEAKRKVLLKLLSEQHERLAQAKLGKQKNSDG
jgi:hypothetical protein